MAFVVLQHLSPDFNSLMDELLARFMDLPVRVVEGSMALRPDEVYLLPPRKEMVLEGHMLVTREKATGHSRPEQMVINTFFFSLAQEAGPRGAAVVLSGTGTDGSLGARSVRESGGLVLVQDPQDAKFSGMPRSAISTGMVQAVLSPEEMPGVLMHYVRDASLPGPAATPAAGEGDENIESIFSRLSDVYGIDFKHYKPSTIARRIERRISMRGVADLEAYCRLIVVDDEELDGLYQDLLIGVTQFFRDPDAFLELRMRVVPDILSRVPPDEDVRVWVSGCATGEEVYSLGMLFIEAMESQKRPINLKIFATDMHRGSLQIAAEGRYTEESLKNVPVELRQTFFEQSHGSFQVNPRLRRPVIFSPHNILGDPPFTRLDLVSCRNLLIYLKADAQMRAMASFFFALKPQSYLFLGPSENPGELHQELQEVSRQWKIFQRPENRTLPANLRQRLSLSRRPPTVHIPAASTHTPLLTRLYDALLSRYIPDSILVNDRREILHSFGEAGQFLSPPTGRMVNDVVLMARDELRLALSSCLHQSLKTQKPASQHSIHFQDRVLNLTAEPMFDRISSAWNVLLLFEDISHSEPAALVPLPVSAERDALVQDHIESLETELRHMRESLQQTVEELETSNEELQASNEELLAANEELQSTNEELHAVNEELHAVNSEYEHKINVLDEVSSDLRNLIQATDIGTIFLDSQYRIRLFTPAVTRLFNLLEQDIGRDLRHITSQIHGDDVFDEIAEVLASAQPRIRRVILPSGASHLRRILPYLNGERHVVGVVLTFVDITEQVRAEELLRDLNTDLEARVATRTHELEEANQQLAENEALTRRWLDLATDGVWDRNLLTDEEYLSPQFKALFGYDAHEHPDLEQILSPEEQARMATALQEHLERGQPYSLDVRYRHKDGSTVWVLRRGMALQDEDGRYVQMLGTHTDITALKAAEERIQELNATLSRRVIERTEALRERESHFEALIEGLPALVWTSQPDGSGDYFSPQWLAYTGCRAESQLGYGWLQSLHPEDQEPVMAAWLHAVATLEVMEISFRLCRHDGEHRWFRSRALPLRSAQGEVVRWIGITLDIHEQVTAMESLQASEHRLRQMIEGALQPILTINSSGRVVGVNQQTVETFGFSREELIGQPVEILVPRVVRSSHVLLREGFTQDPQARLMRPGRTVQAQRKDGSTFPVEIGLVPLERGGSVEVVAFIRDLTELHDLSRERDAITLKMTETQRLESLGLLAGGIAHDFNNILTSIMANVSLMQLGDMSAAETRTAIDAIAIAGRRAAALCQQLLAYSGKGRFVVAAADFNELVDDTMQLLEASLTRQVSLVSRLARPMPHPLVDAAQIQQVVMNLVLNAIEACGDGGQVQVETSVVTMKAPPTARWSSGQVRQGRYVLLTVQDNGAGISDENFSRIFEPFFTTKFTGRGLGLAAVQGIIRGHDGLITVDSREGRGTTFRVYLPTRTLPGEEAPSTGPQLRWKGQGQVLVVDDEEAVREACRKMLSRYGFTVTVAHDGDAGHRCIFDAPRSFTLILLDLMMPGRDGLTLLREIRAEDPEVPVLLMSGHSPQDISLPATDTRVSFLPKPFTYTQFIDAIHVLLTNAGIPIFTGDREG